MIIISGTLKLSPEDFQAILPAAVDMVAATREEPGCIEYEFSQVIGEPGTIRIWERWENPDSLDGHFAAEHMLAWREAMGEVTVIERDLSRYEGVDTIMPLA